MTVYNHDRRTKRHTEQPMFLGADLGMQRYDEVRYPFFDELTTKQMGFFWIPDEVDCSRDAKDFRDLTSFEQHIFTSNLKRQIVLDSVQGRSPNLALLPIVSLPEVERWIETWAFFETIHSQSYTHIIQAVYADPTKVFDEIDTIPEIKDCADGISFAYDNLMDATAQPSIFPRYEHKRAIWKAIMAANILEGVRFYVSFACAWAFAELKKMEGNAKIIKFICRDENLHLAGTQQMLKMLVKEDKYFAKIAEEERENDIAMFVSAVEQEKTWAKYLFKDGSMIGLSEELLCQYIEWIAHKRMLSVGLESPYKGGSNPLPWTEKWIAGREVQVAPQETEITSYVAGGIKKDVDENTFKGVKL